jgi:cell fate regulator YaaT (PSP1 superfamily)
MEFLNKFDRGEVKQLGEIYICNLFIDCVAFGFHFDAVLKCLVTVLMDG